MRIAVLGTLVNHKGARTIASVAEMADPNRIEIHLIGRTEGPFSGRALTRMKLTGPYNDADLAGLIETTAPHLIWFPAVWPETYSYTLSTAIEAGIDSFAAAVQRILVDRGLSAAMTARGRQLSRKYSLDVMIDQYDALVESVLTRPVTVPRP